MWSSVQVSHPAPSSRSKHAMCVSQEGFIYLMGGRSANLPLKDLWKFDPVQSVWEELKCRGNRPPCLQEHTMVCWKNTLYVFGGEIGFASTGETPLWILDLNTLLWKKHHVRGSSVHQPSGRRGHSAVVFNGVMHVFGGYQDLRGSSSELWTFDLHSERWTLLLTPSYFEQPPPRHNHSCVVHDAAMWIYGGLTDLQPRADFWKWDLTTLQWSRVKVQRGPGELHSHAAVKGLSHMYIFGGERSGITLNELWRFHFATDVWEKMNAEGVVPPPRCRHVAVPNPALHPWGIEAWGERASSPHPPPKSISMCFGQTEATKRPSRFKVHPVSRFCSKNTSSDEEDDDDEYTVTYNPASAPQVNLRTLRDKFQSSRLVRSISSGSYSILHNPHQLRRGDELESLVEERRRPRLKIQKSQSSDAVLESDSEYSTPQHGPGGNDSPPLWVENPNTLLRSSWSEHTFQRRTSNGGECCTTLGRLAFDGQLATVRDVIEENSESADEPNLAARTDLLVDLDEGPRANRHTPSADLPHSVSHSSGYHSFTEEEGDCHREFAGCLNASAAKRPSLGGRRDLELKTFGGEMSCEVVLPPPPPKHRARSLDRASQRKLVRSYPSAGSITPTVLLSDGVVEESFRSSRSATTPDRQWAKSPARLERHQWQLCFYMFGGREQGAPGVYRQPMSVWKLYV